MNWPALLNLMDVFSRFYVALALVCLGVISWRVARSDGILYRRLTLAWFCLALPFTLNAVGIIEQCLELFPAIDLRTTIRKWMWVTHLAAGTACWAFWDALSHQNTRRP
jgi:hypothetical protein